MFLKIMFSAGEPSGDVHGAMLAKEILKLAPQTELVGFGGENMAKNGVALWENLNGYNFMGVVDVVKNLRKIFRLLNRLTDLMAKERPDLLVIIDYPDFNWRLAKRAKKLGIKVFSYIPPSAWAWRKGRAKKCAKIADELAAIFPFELPVYQKAGANISFLGNPLVDTVTSSMTKSEARKHFGIGEKERGILLLPGSRRHEINLLLPAMTEAAKKLLTIRPDTKFFLPVAQGIDEELIKEKLSDLPVTLTHENRYELMTAADAAMATSGTVVLEAAILGLPCVVLYRFSALNYFIAKRLVTVKNFSLPNIILDAPLQKELLQEAVTADNIVAEISALYEGEGHREEVLAGLKKAVALLGEKGAAGRVAAKILAAAQTKQK